MHPGLSLLSAFIFLLFGLPAQALSQQSEQKALGVIATTRGEPDVLRNARAYLPYQAFSPNHPIQYTLYRNKYWQLIQAQKDTILYHGDLLIARDYPIQLTLRDGFKVILGKNSRLFLTRKRVLGEERSFIGQLVSLLNGKLRASIKKKKNKIHPTQFKSRSMTVGVRGTDFILSQSSEESRLIVAEGQVEAAPIPLKEQKKYESMMDSAASGDEYRFEKGEKSVAAQFPVIAEAGQKVSFTKEEVANNIIELKQAELEDIGDYRSFVGDFESPADIEGVSSQLSELEQNIMAKQNIDQNLAKKSEDPDLLTLAVSFQKADSDIQGTLHAIYYQKVEISYHDQLGENWFAGVQADLGSVNIKYFEKLAQEKLYEDLSPGLDLAIFLKYIFRRESFTLLPGFLIYMTPQSYSFYSSVEGEKQNYEYRIGSGIGFKMDAHWQLNQQWALAIGVGMSLRSFEYQTHQPDVQSPHPTHDSSFNSSYVKLGIGYNLWY